MKNMKLYVWIPTFALFFIYCFAIYALNRKQGITKRTWEPYLIIFPVMLILFMLYGYPLIDSVTMAFQNYKLSNLNKIYFNGLTNFKNLYKESATAMIIKNSLKYVIVGVSGQFLLGLTLAMALRKKFRFRNVYQSLVFLPWSFSAFIVGLMFRWSFNGEYGVVNDILLKLGLVQERVSFLGSPKYALLVVMIAMIWMGVPFFAIMLLAALQSIPSDVYESAEIDGAGPITTFFSITIPYIKPTIITTILLRSIWIFNSFDLIVIITEGGPANSSQTLPSYMYNQAFAAFDFGRASAIGLMLMFVLTLYAFLFLKVTNYDKAGDF